MILFNKSEEPEKPKTKPVQEKKEEPAEEEISDPVLDLGQGNKKISKKKKKTKNS